MMLAGLLAAGVGEIGVGGDCLRRWRRPGPGSEHAATELAKMNRLTASLFACSRTWRVPLTLVCRYSGTVSLEKS